MGVTTDMIKNNSSVRHLSLAADEKVLVEDIESWETVPNFIHISHGTFASENSNIIRISRTDQVCRRLLVNLASRGFYLYKSSDEESRMVQHTYLPKLWNNLRNGEFGISDEGIVFHLEEPKDKTTPKRMLVVFSSIHENMYTSSLMRHFMHNFGSIGKYIPKDTLILRIADVGSIVGAFYLNTNYLPNNDSNIQFLIENIRSEYKISSESCVLYGVSKGGTGALYHGLLGNYRCVAVDPIVSDAHYINRHGDSHFTNDGLFPLSKQEVFSNLIEGLTQDRPKVKSSRPRWSVVFSDRSPQYPYISTMLVEPMSDYMNFYNSRNLSIRDHPDVGGATVNTATMLMNSHLYGLHLHPGVFNID